MITINNKTTIDENALIRYDTAEIIVKLPKAVYKIAVNNRNRLLVKSVFNDLVSPNTNAIITTQYGALKYVLKYKQIIAKLEVTNLFWYNPKRK